MKRSEINKHISQALSFFSEMNFHLPPWGYWSPLDWKKNYEDCTEVIENQLGWDLTDFGSGAFLETGLYHQFYGEAGKGRVLVGEVSAVNDDFTDNRFYKEVGRFPEIEEDTDPTYFLTVDYKQYLSSKNES
jgi:D-lyxose ketol-isomerase